MIELQNVHGQNYVLYDRYQFDLSSRGITLLTGANRAGKSLIPSSIPLILYGQPPVTSDRQKVKLKEVMMRKSAICGLTWKNGKDKWSVDIETKGQSQKYRLLHNGKDLNLHRKGDAEDKIRKAFPIGEELLYTCYYLSASQPHVLHSGTPAQRMAFIESLSDFGVYDEMRKDFSERLNKLRGQVGNLAEYEERLEALGEPLDLDALRKQLKIVDSKIRKRQETVRKQRDRLSRLDKYIELSKTKTEGDHAELVTQIVFLRAKYEKLKQRIKRVRNIEENNIRALENEKQRKQLAKNIEGFDFKARPEKTDKLEASLRQMQREYDEAERYHLLLSKLVKEVRQSGPLKKIFTPKELLEDKKGKLLDKLSKRFAVHDLIVNLPPHEQSCPVCQHQISAVKAKKIVKEAKGVSTKELERALYIVQQRATVPKIVTKEQLEKLKADIDAVSDKVAKANLARDNYRRMHEYRVRLKQMDKSTEPKFQKVKVSSKKLHDRLRKLATKGQKLKASIAVAEQMADLKIDGLSVDDARAELKTLTKAHDSLNAAILKLNTKRANLSNKIDQEIVAQDERKRLSEKLRVGRKIKKKLPIYEGLVQAYGARGIKVDRINRFATELEMGLNDMAAEVFVEPIYFTIKVSPSNMQIMADRNGLVGPVGLLSGSEGRQFRMLLALVFLSLIPKEHRLNLCVLDEMESLMDKTTLDHFANTFIPRLQKDVPHVLVVSPLDHLWIDGATKYRVTKTNGRSRIDKA